mmetsp:Transcript_74132/g.217540  ORF Transcript_74132/g.217540 Transcript_74132/m.217540 type:complete len:225 (-) Transcript_74132:453-1127(-)
MRSHHLGLRRRAQDAAATPGVAAAVPRGRGASPQPCAARNRGPAPPGPGSPAAARSSAAAPVRTSASSWPPGAPLPLGGARPAICRGRRPWPRAPAAGRPRGAARPRRSARGARQDWPQGSPARAAGALPPAGPWSCALGLLGPPAAPPGGAVAPSRRRRRPASCPRGARSALSCCGPLQQRVPAHRALRLTCGTAPHAAWPPAGPTPPATGSASKRAGRPQPP